VGQLPETLIVILSSVQDVMVEIIAVETVTVLKERVTVITIEIVMATSCVAITTAKVDGQETEVHLIPLTTAVWHQDVMVEMIAVETATVLRERVTVITIEIVMATSCVAITTAKVDGQETEVHLIPQMTVAWHHRQLLAQTPVQTQKTALMDGL